MASSTRSKQNAPEKCIAEPQKLNTKVHLAGFHPPRTGNPTRLALETRQNYLLSLEVGRGGLRGLGC